MSKDRLPNSSDVPKGAKSLVDRGGNNELTGKLEELTEDVAAMKTMLTDPLQLVKQGANVELSEVSTLSEKVATLADLTGNEKLAAKVAKVQKTAAQAERIVSQSSDVIRRVQQINTRATRPKTFMDSNRAPEAESSPQDLLTALFKRSPSGLQFTLKAGSLPPTTFSVISFHVESRYNSLYCLDVAVSSPNPSVSAGAVLDGRAVLTIWQDGEAQQTFTGMVGDFEQGDSGFRLTHYRLKIYPDLWRTTLRHNSRIFQQKDIQTILSTILSENRVADYAFLLRHSHPEREFCVQYQETDFDFFQRITSEEGIFYYVEQSNGQHCLIMTDDVSTLKGSVTLPYNVNKNAQLQEKCITTFNRTERVRTSRVQLKDYTFKKPNWDATFDVGGGYEHYDYPGRFKDGRGKQYTNYRLESLRQDAQQGWGESNSPNLQVGKWFTLQMHPNESLNKRWQISGIVYEGRQPQSSELEAGDKSTTLINRFDFMPIEQTWRPYQRTKPRVDGPQIAIVVGPPGEEIYTDNFGRIRLQFLWDREGNYDDHSSCWIRVTQPWAGKGWGMIAIPRVGHEVVVDFLDGDPDQPIVTGRSYHANMPLPADLPSSKTQMHVMSQTYKGGGYNGVLMDDATGAQRLDFQAQKDMTTDVLNNKTTTVDNEHSELINKTQNITVRGDRTKTVLQQELVTLNNSSINEVGVNRTLVSQKQLLVSSQGGDITLSAGGSLISLSNDGTVVISGSGTVTINGSERVYINNGVVSDANVEQAVTEEDVEEESEGENEFLGGLMAAGMMAVALVTRGKVKPKGSAKALTETQKINNKIVPNPKEIGVKEVKPTSTNLESHRRLNTADIGGNGKLKPAEAAVAAQLEGTLGKMERYKGHAKNPPDFVITEGKHKGKTLDIMYSTDRLTNREVDMLNKFYEKNMNVGSGKRVIIEHLNKADYVPVDFRVLNSENQKIFLDFIKTLPKEQQGKIILIK